MKINDQDEKSTHRTHQALRPEQVAFSRTLVGGEVVDPEIGRVSNHRLVVRDSTR
jgi:hypothetical protein